MVAFANETQKTEDYIMFSAVVQGMLSVQLSFHSVYTTLLLLNTFMCICM